jgi:hypothetical protein
MLLFPKVKPSCRASYIFILFFQMAFLFNEDIRDLINNNEAFQLGQISMPDITDTPDMGVVALWRPLTRQVLLRLTRTDHYVAYDDGNILNTLIEFFRYSNDVIFAVSNLRVFEQNADGEDNEVDIVINMHDSRWSDFFYHNQVFCCTVRLVTNDESESTLADDTTPVTPSDD